MKVFIVTVLVLVSGAFILRAAPSPAPATSKKAARVIGVSPSNPACAQLKALDAKQKSDIQALEAQIKNIREELERQLKPLEEQRRTQGEQYRSQREALMDQIQPGSGDAKKAYDEQLRAVEEKEQEEIRGIRERYGAMRRELKPPRPNLNCR